MKTYFEPKMNITAFDSADVITTSGGFDSATQNVQEGDGTFTSVKYGELQNLTSFNADTKVAE